MNVYSRINWAVLPRDASAGGVRRKQDVRQMEQQYGWPRHHREGFPDLVGPEVDIQRMIEPFNADHPNVQIVLVNQFGWSRDRVSSRLPHEASMADLRRATDVEFGMATYEPFGCGAVCIISSVCGCEGFVEHVTSGRAVPNVIKADFTRLDNPRSIDQLKAMTTDERYGIEQSIAAEIAGRLMEVLPFDDAARAALIESGQQLIARMGWDQVIEEGLLPMLERICEIPAQRVG